MHTLSHLLAQTSTLQAAPHLITGIHQAGRQGRLGTFDPGTFLLVRHEDRLMWIQLLEKGNGYCSYSVKVCP